MIDGYQAILVGDEFGEEVLIKSIYKLPVKYISKLTSPDIDIDTILAVVRVALKNEEQINFIEDLDSEKFQDFINRWVASSVG
jgi:hypothetical protein